MSVSREQRPLTDDSHLGGGSPSLVEFSAVFDGCDGFIEFRALPRKAQGFFQLEDEAGMSTFLAAHQEDNLYFGVATRRDGTSGALENCRHLGALFADVDFKVTPEPEARERLARLAVKPSIVINSGGGLHVYWILQEPLELPDEAAYAKALLRRLAGAIGGDLSAAEPARILRLPGTRNYKYDPPRPVRSESLDDDARYTLDELEAALPPEPAANGSGARFTMPDEPVAEGKGRNSLLYGLARSQKARNLSARAIQATVEIENATRCRPPLPDDEVRQILENAHKQPDRADFRGADIQTSATGIGNALRFVAKHGNDVRYVKVWRQWLIWDGTHWKPDKVGRVMELAKEVAVELYREAVAADDKTRRWAAQTASVGRLEEMLALASTDPRVAASPEQFDAVPYVFNVQNGTLDLRTGTLRPHRKEDMLSKIAAVEYIPGAQAEVWTTFLAQTLPRPVVRRYTQKVLGAALLGDPVDQRLYFAQGPEATGKSTFLNAVRTPFGTYGGTVDPETLLKKRNDPGVRDDLADLEGLRLVTSVEPQDGRGWDAQRIQQLTGGDPVKARHLYAKLSTYKPRFTLLVGANNRPSVPASNGAFWRRLRLIRFDQHVPEDQRDRTLPKQLEEPSVQQAILVWLVEGCLAWQAEPALSEPASVIRDTADYRVENELLGPFLAALVFEKDAFAPSSELDTAFFEWVREEEIDARIASKAVLNKRLRELGCKNATKWIEGKKIRGWFGVRLGEAGTPERDGTAVFSNSPYRESPEEVPESGVPGCPGVPPAEMIRRAARAARDRHARRPHR